MGTDVALNGRARLPRRRICVAELISVAGASFESQAITKQSLKTASWVQLINDNNDNLDEVLTTQEFDLNALKIRPANRITSNINQRPPPNAVRKET
ncbi:hypothetical protein V495_08694 [Pseudogymnoascus sp. VKM F-4514 (FW-929)]|nr:hypothetical protein V495_08694 [Pseudogymnoascus sp. VKM F-4514 (FW-929)]KFY55471.1 hypothetical protein V497_06934 [Pseudogymnoascus sp. VKM F-4516 (FW-969)]